MAMLAGGGAVPESHNMNYHDGAYTDTVAAVAMPPRRHEPMSRRTPCSPRHLFLINVQTRSRGGVCVCVLLTGKFKNKNYPNAWHGIA
jgi:hypothetical protein